MCSEFLASSNHFHLVVSIVGELPPHLSNLTHHRKTQTYLTKKHKKKKKKERNNNTFQIFFGTICCALRLFSFSLLEQLSFSSDSFNEAFLNPKTKTQKEIFQQTFLTKNNQKKKKKKKKKRFNIPYVSSP